MTHSPGERCDACEVCKLLVKNDGDVSSTVSELAELMCKFVDDSIVNELLTESDED